MQRGRGAFEIRRAREPPRRPRPVGHRHADAPGRERRPADVAVARAPGDPRRAPDAPGHPAPAVAGDDDPAPVVKRRPAPAEVGHPGPAKLRQRPVAARVIGRELGADQRPLGLPHAAVRAVVDPVAVGREIILEIGVGLRIVPVVVVVDRRFLGRRVLRPVDLRRVRGRVVGIGRLIRIGHLVGLRRGERLLRLRRRGLLRARRRGEQDRRRQRE